MNLSDLNKEQLAAVQHDTGPLLVVAGAGTGKTQVITRRIAYLIEERGVPASQILALTFTDKAALEMQERVDALLPYGVVDTNVMTFHSFGDQLVREYGIEMGLAAGAVAMSTAQQLVFMRDHIDEFNLEYFAPIGRPDQLLGDLVRYFGRLKEEIISPEAYLAYAASLEELDKEKHTELGLAYQTYCRLTRQQGLMDFADQIALPLELLAKRPNIVKQLRKRYRYILVDEFQDTNVAQNKLVEYLAGPKGNIMVVGDDDQSIYKFRGAAISNILSFTKTYKNAAQIVLTENYRSSQPILDAAYRLIQHNNPDRLEVRNAINKQLHGQTKGPEPRLLTAATLDDEYEQVAVEIAKAVKAGESAGDMVVLIRKRNQAAGVIRALKQEGIDYHYAGNESLYDRPEVAVLRDFLAVVVNPTDSVALHHLLASPIFAVPVEDLMKWGAKAKQTNSSLEEIVQQINQLPQILQQLSEWRQASRDMTVGQLLFKFSQDTGYLDNLVEAAGQDPAREQQVRNVASFFSSINEYEKVASDSSVLAYQQIEETLRQAGETTEISEIDASADQVQILTVHAAKGLEFERVFIIDLVKNTFPSVNRRSGLAIPDELIGEDVPEEGVAHIAEERRLMYVALTRAKKHLTLSWAADHGGKRAKKPSPFIAEAFGAEPEAHTETSVQGVLQFTKNFSVDTKKEVPHTARFIQGDWLALTPHQIDDYLTCPLNFYYKHVLEVPQPPEAGLMYGTLMHSLIHSYYLQRQNGEVDVAALHTALDIQWRSEGFVSKGQEQRRKDQAHKTLDAFIKRQKDAAEVPTRMEFPFEFELPDVKVRVRGRIDAVIEGDKTVEIRDYKTSEVDDQKKADKKAKDSLQLATYALAWKSMMGELPTTTTLDYVETGIRGSFTPTESSTDSLMQKIQQVAEGIRSGQYPATGDHFYCIHRKPNEVNNA